MVLNIIVTIDSFLVVIDNFSKFAWCIPLKYNKSQTMKYSFENIPKSSKRKPKLIETDRGNEFYSSLFQNFLKNNNIRHFSRNTYLGAVFEERFNRTIRNLLERPVFEKCDCHCIDILLKITKQFNNRIHTSTKLTLIQASLKKNEGSVCKNLLEKKVKSKLQVTDLIRVADLKTTFSKRDTTNWSYKVYKITEIIIDTIPSYKIHQLPERYNESLFKKTELTKKENKVVMKKLNLN